MVQNTSVKLYLYFICFDGLFLSCSDVKSTVNDLLLFSIVNLFVHEYIVSFGRIRQYDFTLPLVLNGVSCGYFELFIFEFIIPIFEFERSIGLSIEFEIL